MSLDETNERMRVFAAVLDRFDEALRGSLATLNDRHAEVEGEWRDAFARDYEAAWATLADSLRRWVSHEAPTYRQFMSEKLQILQEYLRGDQ